MTNWTLLAVAALACGDLASREACRPRRQQKLPEGAKIVVARSAARRDRADEQVRLRAGAGHRARWPTASASTSRGWSSRRSPDDLVDDFADRRGASQGRRRRADHVHPRRPVGRACR